MSSTKIPKDYQDGYDLGYKKGYVDGAKGTIEDDPFWDVDYRAAVSVKLDSGDEIKIQARYVRRLRNEKG